MTRYIDADALVKSYEYVYCRNCTRSPQPAICKSCWVDDAVDVVLDSPDEDVAPVVHAHWKRKFKREGVYEDLWLYCSNCNSRTAEEYAPYWWTYCPYCGAIMDEKEGKE